jgi:steroid delta-isomerase-like uncharacterized protein
VSAESIIRSYYDAFNREDTQAFLALLDDDVVHDINQGEREYGKAAFARFMDEMSRCYSERIEDLVVLTEPGGSRAAAEFIVVGKYLASQPGLPTAQGQEYRLPVGAFFELRAGLISRVTNYYNLRDWLQQVN